MGSLLVLQPLQPGMAAEELEFRWCPFWVQVHGLPFEKMTRAHGEVIGNRIGRLMEIEALSDGPLLHWSFLRLRVEVDVTKPLLQGFVLHRRGGTRPGDDGVKVYYKYEKLSEFCYDCGSIRHDKQSCKFVSRETGLSSGYGPNQRTGVARSLHSLRTPPMNPMADQSAGREKPASLSNFPIGHDGSVEERLLGGASGLCRTRHQNLEKRGKTSKDDHG
ncbi:hypothetical protein LOK49_LG06G00979 [Camellia lanceoleosa]|uniref:Uncharacterized protein n=1 Tax=Camellia lanceoleosa TaxID=1840588 RepID=A0ACC0HCG3_9ERIC|nr:hypothetical protein LOK49_LG06G00979 [Camellia lanceoleosa]